MTLLRKPDVLIVGVNINKHHAYANARDGEYTRVCQGIYFKSDLDQGELFRVYGFRITKHLLASAALTHSTAWYKMPMDGRIYVGGAYPYKRKIGQQGDFAIIQSMISARNNDLLNDMLSNSKLFITTSCSDPIGDFDMYSATDELIMLSMFESTKINKEKHLPASEMDELMRSLLEKHGGVAQLCVALQEVAELTEQNEEYNRALKELLKM